MDVPEDLIFVAMRFDVEPWRDKRYLVIQETAEEAGYRTLRADEIKTSGPVVDEVCAYLRHARTVIIDTTGDSHSVSYELGFCHGCGRDPSSLLLLRRGTGRDIPFNYRHYRHRCYRDLAHLRRLLRDWYGLTVPLSDDSLGYVIVFEIPEGITLYGSAAASAVLCGLRELQFSGRCEYYASDLRSGSRLGYAVGLGLRFSRRRSEFTYQRWIQLREAVRNAAQRIAPGLRVDDNSCELAEMRAIRTWMMPRGSAEFGEGIPVRVLSPDSPHTESWFISRVSGEMGNIDESQAN